MLLGVLATVYSDHNNWLQSIVQLLTLLYCFADMSAGMATKDPSSENLDHFGTPDEASVEFGILLNEIIMELEKNEVHNLRSLKTILSTLTVQRNSSIRVFNDKQMEEIQACNSIDTILRNKMRHCYRWDDCSMLCTLMLSVDSKICSRLIKKFELKVNSKIKLQQIYEYCKQKSVKLSEEYHKIVAIVNSKIFSDITLEEYHELKHFVSKQCGVEDYVISPFIKASSS